MLAEPADGGMTGFVYGDGTLFFCCHDLCLLLQTAYDAVDGIEEVLLAHVFLIVTSRYKGSLVADISDVGARKARRLACKEIDVKALVNLQWPQMDVENSLTLGEVRQVNVYLSVKAAGT